MDCKDKTCGWCCFKICTGCDKIKRLSFFPWCRKYGRKQYCRDCTSEMKRKYYVNTIKYKKVNEGV